jgi:hypothetical protein
MTNRFGDHGQEHDGDVLVFRGTAGDPIAVPSDVVTAAERAYRCYQLRVGGKSWEQVAELEKYPSASSAKYDVDRYMEEARALVVEASQKEMLTLEVHRLDALQDALWLNAMSGHVPSAGMCMNLIMNRAKLTVEFRERVGADADHARTVVVPVENDGYLQALMDAAGETQPTDLGAPDGSQEHTDPSAGTSKG